MTLQRGAYRNVGAVGDVLLYERELDGERILVALNLTDTAAEVESGPFNAPGSDHDAHIAIAPENEFKGAIALRPNEGAMIWSSRVR